MRYFDKHTHRLQIHDHLSAAGEKCDMNGVFLIETEIGMFCS